MCREYKKKPMLTGKTISKPKMRSAFHMANVITGCRIVCGLLMLCFPAFSTWFYIVYIVGGISDVLDGFIARCFHQVTVFGSKLDTVADAVFILASLMKVTLTVHIPIWVYISFALIALIKVVNVVGGLIVFKRLIAEHTETNKLTGALVFFVPFIMGFFPRETAAVYVIITCIIATFAAIQEGYYIVKGKEIS